VWDGRDYWGGLIDSAKTPYLILHWTETETMSATADAKPIEYKEGQTQAEVVAALNFPGRHLHSAHQAEYETVPLLKITGPVPGQVLSGKITVKASVAKKRRGMGDKYGYGVRYYIDDQIIHEEFYKPDSEGEFSYQLDTTAFENGNHLLYVGVCDHNEHVTSDGLEVVIRN